MSVNRQSSTNSAALPPNATQLSATQQTQQGTQNPYARGPSIQLPLTDKGLRACKNCHRVLTEGQFQREGCHGCYPKGNGAVPRGRINEFTTQQFSGYVGVVDPSMSWVARLIGLRKKDPMGVYAAHVDSDEDDYDEDEDDSVMGNELRGDYRGEDGEEGEFEDVVFDRHGGDASSVVASDNGVAASRNASEAGGETRVPKKARLESNYDNILDGLL